MNNIDIKEDAKESINKLGLYLAKYDETVSVEMRTIIRLKVCIFIEIC